MEPDGGALHEVCQMIEMLASGRVKKLVVHKLPFVRVHHGTELVLSCGSYDRGLEREGSGNRFLWESSPAAWNAAAGKLACLIDNFRPSHAYFDAADNPIVVVVSKDEYGEQWWTQHAD